MSVFRKFTPGAGAGGFQRKSSLPGTKSWVYGQSLLSTGCSDLDNACGTGIPLGSIMIVSEEIGIHQASVLGRLFMAEGIHSKQRVLVISSKSSEAVSMLVAKLPSLRAAANSSGSGTSVSSQSSSVNAIRQSSSVNAIRQSSSVNAIRQSSSVNAIRQSSSVNAIRQSSSVNAIRQSSSVNAIRQSSSVNTTRQSPSMNATRQSPSMNANSTTSPQPATKPRAWQYGKYLSHTSTLTRSLPHRPNRSHSLLPLLRPQPEREGYGAAQCHRLLLRGRNQSPDEHALGRRLLLHALQGERVRRKSVPRSLRHPRR